MKGHGTVNIFFKALFFLESPKSLDKYKSSMKTFADICSSLPFSTTITLCLLLYCVQTMTEPCFQLKTFFLQMISRQCAVEPYIQSKTFRFTVTED
jgi:hypothetical protein